MGGLKRPQNLVRGPYVDWFDFKKIPFINTPWRIFALGIFFQPISIFFFKVLKIERYQPYGMKKHNIIEIEVS